MVLYIVGIGIVLGFVTLLWRQHKTSAGWQREASFLMDLVALSATALVVGVLVITQLGSIEQIASGSDSTPSERIIVGQKPTEVSVQPTLESEEASEVQEAEAEVEAGAEADQESEDEAEEAEAEAEKAEAEAEKAEAGAEAEQAEATLEVNETVEPTSEIKASRTPSATKTTQATKSATPIATKKVTSTATAKVTQTAKVTKTPTPTRTATPSVYIVRNGDVFSVIAKQFDLALEELMAANPNVNPERLKVGEELIIPLPKEDDAAADESDDAAGDEVSGTKTVTQTVTQTVTRTPARTATIAPRTYIVRGGDTLSQIAERFDVTMDEILRANPTINAENLKLDAELIIPPPSTNNNSSSTSGSAQYTVREGDTFSVIAKRFGLTQQELQNANPNVNPDRLSIGLVIRIP